MASSRRTFNNSFFSLIPAAWLPKALAKNRPPTLLPEVSGPLRGGDHGWPFASPVEDLSRHGYVMEEYTLAGVAKAYRVAQGGRTPRNGQWDTESGNTADYVTRAYVVRPESVADFNGIAVVNWQNVTAGFDIGSPINSEIFRGYAWIGVTTQKIGVDGTEGLTKGLRQWDSTRYGKLNHPGDAWSYDIFTQAGRLVSRGDTALLGGLKPELVIATGGSQSAMRLGSYLNAAHPHTKVFDGFYLTVHWGICPPIEEMPLMELFAPTRGELSPAMCQIRDDGDVPILVVATECEARYNYPVRQADTNTFRFWEIAGASHQSPYRASKLAEIMKRDGVYLGDSPADRNAVGWGYIDDAALRGMVLWLREGALPASMPRISMTGDENAPIERDDLGNALGGIRTPELEAPVASYRGERSEDLSNPNWLDGMTIPLEESELTRRYPNANDRIERWHKAVDHLIEKGLVLPEDAEALRRRGNNSHPYV